jgi:glycosyltransferase involved in cell wall biosynthesis
MQIGYLQTKINPDFIFAHFTMPAGLAARKWFLKYKIPYVVVLHGSDVPGYQPGRFKLIHIPMQIVARMVWKHAEHVVAVGHPLKELANKTWKRDISVIPNGVDLNIFVPLENKEFPDSTSQIKFALTSQLIPRKGIQHLIQAISMLSEEHRKRLKINIYGTGPYKTELEKMIDSSGLNEQIQLCGLIAKENMCQTLQSNDMFIMSSLQEGLPLSLLEAMACGLPPIVTRVGDVESVITNNQDGILIQPASPEEIKSALEKVLNNPSIISEMRDKTIGRSHEFSWDKIWRQYKELM